MKFFVKLFIVIMVMSGSVKAQGARNFDELAQKLHEQVISKNITSANLDEILAVKGNFETVIAMAVEEVQLIKAEEIFTEIKALNIKFSDTQTERLSALQKRLAYKFTIFSHDGIAGLKLKEARIFLESYTGNEMYTFEGTINKVLDIISDKKDFTARDYVALQYTRTLLTSNSCPPPTKQRFEGLLVEIGSMPLLDGVGLDNYISAIKAEELKEMKDNMAKIRVGRR
ncbi:MAG: hypothetical protein WCQ47_01935 [bacterium]